MTGRFVSYLGQHHIGLLALFIALSGTAYAATLPRNSVGPSQIKANAVRSSEVKNRSLVATDFKLGQLPAGPTGQTGPTGHTGQTGQTGQPGASAMMGNTESPPSFLAQGDENVAPSGPSTPTVGSQPQLTPNATVVLRDLSVSLGNVPGGTASRTFRLQAGGSVGPTCTVGPSEDACNSGAQTLTVPPGTQLILSTLATGAPASTSAAWGFRMTTP